MVYGFNALIPFSGMAGLNQIRKTRDTQEALLKESTVVKREAQYFKDNIGNVTNGDDLVDDTRLLRVALDAYGLGEEFSKKAYIRNILKSDLSDPTSAANRLTDPRWKAFARAFVKSEPSVPGPLNNDFASKMTARAYGNELGNYVSADVIAKMTTDSEAFRISMKNIKTADQLVNNKEALAFVKKAFGLGDTTKSKEEIVAILNQQNEYALNDDNSAKVPDEWKAARKMLSFFNESYTIGVDEGIKDVLPNSTKTIEKVISQSFKQALSEKMGYFDYQKKVDVFKESLGDYKNVDDFLSDTKSMNFIKEAYGLTADNSTDEQIKFYLTARSNNNIPAKWLDIRDKLGFTAEDVVPANHDLTDFKTALASYNSVDDLLADTDTLEKLKVGYELQYDTADLATIRTYLTSTDDNLVPSEWRDLRDGLGFHNGSAPPTSDVIDDFASLYNIATGTRGDLEEGVNVANIGEIIAQHKTNNVSYLSGIAKFERFQKEADHFALEIGFATNDIEVISDSRSLRFAMTAMGLESQSFDSFKAYRVLTGEQKLGNSPLDEKWKDFRENFSFSQSNNNLRTEEDGFADKIIDEYVDNSFIEAVGEQDPDMRLALYFDKRIQEVLKEPKIDEFGWFAIAGETPLATVFQTVFGLPSTFGQLDVDKQKDIYERRSASVLGAKSFTGLADKDKRDSFIQEFMLKSAFNNGLNGGNGNDILTLLGG